MINPTYKKAFFTSAPSAEAYLGDLKSDGTIPLTADWNVGAFDLTCVDMNATNFKLSGVGTLTSALGNVSLTTALTAASGDEVALKLNYTTNKAAGNDTGLLINQTDTASPGTSYLINAQVGGSSKFYVTNTGSCIVADGFYAPATLIAFSGNPGTKLHIDGDVGYSPRFTIATNTATSGNGVGLSVTPTYNQTSGTAANTDLLINRTETAVGSGTQRLMSAQVGSVEKAAIDNKGAITSTMINNTDSDTDEIDSVVFAGGYGMVIAASVTDGTSAVWKLKGTVFEAIEVDADWTATKDNASSYNVYIESGSIKLQNKVGNNKNVKLGYFGI